MSVKLDDVDRRILMFLQGNARISFAEIARRLNVGESMVRFRVDRLKKRSVITRFTALIDPRKVGLNVTAILMLKIEAEYVQRVLDELNLLKGLHHLFKCTGEYDSVAILHARDLRHLNGIVTEVKKLPGVRDLKVQVLTVMIKMGRRLKL